MCEIKASFPPPDAFIYTSKLFWYLAISIKQREGKKSVSTMPEA